MYDLHSHLLPGVDDGAENIDVALAMAQEAAAQGVVSMACTPHILPGVYENEGPRIRLAVSELQRHLDDAGIPLRLVAGADNHVPPDFVGGLKSGQLLSLGDTHYVLVEPPHHVAPPRLQDLFFSILIAGYIPLLTHPERLNWIDEKYALVRLLAERGVWMQITAGSLTGRFGRSAKYWAERMLAEGCVHILASDAHDLKRRPPDLAEGRRAAARLIGDEEAHHLVVTRPKGIIANTAPGDLPAPLGVAQPRDVGGADGENHMSGGVARGGVARRLQRFFAG
jgi:protein-tyrosine phosphatase